MLPQPTAWHDPDALRAWARDALHGLEHGLRAVADGLDCGGGAGELLARDALGAPVVVVVACAADRTVAARVAAAHEFLARNPAVCARLLPEGGFDPRLAPRILVLTAGLPAHGLDALRRLAIDDLEVIGVPGIAGKQPEVIAVAVTAQLLQQGRHLVDAAPSAAAADAAIIAPERPSDSPA